MEHSVVRVFLYIGFVVIGYLVIRDLVSIDIAVIRFSGNKLSVF